MAQYFLSQNPTINNFGTSPFINQDTFVVDTASSSSLTINQEGTDVLVSDGTNSALFTNFTLEQFGVDAGNGGGGGVGGAATIFNTFDGSQILIGSAGTDTAGAGVGVNLTDNASTNDYLAGLTGNDSIIGGSGRDVIYGNQGDDQINFAGVLGANGNSTIFGGQGNDTIAASATGTGNNLIYGNLGNDILTGGLGNDTLFGGQGSDQLNSIGANSTMSGGQGDDVINATGNSASSTNLVYGNQGNDQVTGHGLKDTVFGGQGDDIINYDDTTNGRAAAAVGPTTTGALIYGNVGNDIITGSRAGDTLFGGQGNDFLVGNINGVNNTAVFTPAVVGGAAASVTAGAATGHDVMTGGEGNNTFVENALTTGATAATSDVITDFVSGEDKIEANNAGTAANFRTVLANGQQGCWSDCDVGGSGGSLAGAVPPLARLVPVAVPLPSPTPTHSWLARRTAILSICSPTAWLVLPP